MKTTLQAFKNIKNASWTDEYKFDSGPIVELESDSLEAIMIQLPAIWAKGWEWVEINNDVFSFKCYNASFRALIKEDRKDQYVIAHARLKKEVAK